MTAHDWRRTLADAARAAGATADGAHAMPLLEGAARGGTSDGRAAVASLRAVVAALDEAARSRHAAWDAAELAAARAGLKFLPRLIEQLEIGASASVVMEQLTDLAAAADGPKQDGAATAGWRCPRCGSRRVDEQHSDGTGSGRYVELLCEDCGFYAGFDDGSPDAAGWRTGP